ncbi:MAG: hypothetical protein OJI67_08185 [Prosthecobacter sp.]|nr:hypothetical protein [Prosthecobacter sp.]
MMPPPLPNKDKEHLKVIMICHYVSAGLALPGIAFLVLHYSVMKHFLLNAKLWEKAKEPLPFDPALIPLSSRNTSPGFMPSWVCS